MSRATRATVARAGGALAAVALIAACGSPSGGGGKGSVGRATGAAVLAAIGAAAKTIEPWRCARLDDPIVAAAPPGWAFAGKRLEPAGTGPRPSARIAIVAESRGVVEVTGQALAALRKLLDAEPVDVVVTLGGMGGDADEIGRALAPIAEHAPWLVVAIPGDRESLVAHRSAVAALAAGGARIVDGSQARVVDAGGAILGTLPGAPAPERLGAGSGGCVHDDGDVADLLREVGLVTAAAAKGKRAVVSIVVGQRAPRGASDLAPGGIHAGDVAYARALRAAPVDLVIHAAVDDVAPRPGQARRVRVPLAQAIGAGAIDATPRYRPDGTRIPPTAVVITAGAGAVAWKPLVVKVVP